MNTDPKAYNLNNRVLLKKDMINKIKPNTTVSVETTAPVCSKTKRYLFSRNIDIVSK